ncbi:MAG TPA: 30S ribosomal protein S4e [Candidatus Nanoarchaeia archaeon]|nr:30S ribosomal protein S4e [Candidatus Nanoarchaeia archaeon]
MAHKKATHLSRLAAPGSWPIERKKTKWIMKPKPGTLSLQMGMPISVYLTDILKFTRNKSEAKKVLNQGLVLVNGKAVKEPGYQTGLFDTITVQKYNKTYRVVLDNLGRLKLTEIPAKESTLVPVKVRGKTSIKAGKLQINLSNGWNFISEKDSYKVNDVLIFDAKEKKAVKHLKLEKGNLIYITKGAHSGTIATIKDFVQEGVLRKKKYIVASANDEKLKVLVDGVFVIGKDDPEITVKWQ